MLSTIGAGKEPHLGIINLSTLYALEMLATTPKEYEPLEIRTVLEEKDVPEITLSTRTDTKLSQSLSPNAAGGCGDSPDDMVVDVPNKPARSNGGTRKRWRKK